MADSPYPAGYFLLGFFRRDLKNDLKALKLTYLWTLGNNAVLIGLQKHTFHDHLLRCQKEAIDKTDCLIKQFASEMPFFGQYSRLNQLLILAKQEFDFNFRHIVLNPRISFVTAYDTRTTIFTTVQLLEALDMFLHMIEFVNENSQLPVNEYEGR